MESDTAQQVSLAQHTVAVFRSALAQFDISEPEERAVRRVCCHGGGDMRSALPVVWSVGELVEAALNTAPPLPTPTPAERRRSFRVIQGGLLG
jgi:hypothetical protein